MTVRSVFLALVMVIVASVPLRAADLPADPILAEATAINGQVMFADSGAPGMILAIVRGDRSLVLGYGETEKGNKRSPDGNSLFRVGSITKVFATEALVSLATEGKLSLTDPLQRYSDGARVPIFGTRLITLLDLADHTAGLPCQMEGIPSDAPPTRADRWKWLSGFQLPWSPGTIAAYSNVGFDLLADALEAAGGQPYPDLLRTRVTAPLGMADTSFVPTPEQCGRLMIGSGFGGTVPCSNMTALQGAGGLYSTGNDMVRWLRHNVEDADGRLALSHAVYRQRQALTAAIGFDEAGPMAGLGLGWVITAGEGIHPTLVAKSGALAGFMSYIVFAPGRNVGLFVVVNQLDFAMYSRLTEEANGLIASLVTR